MEHCRPEGKDGEIYCDLYSVDWNLSSIEKRISELKKNAASIGEIAIKLRKEVTAVGDRKTLSKVRDLFRDINDMSLGLQYLEQARTYIKRRDGSGSKRKGKARASQKVSRAA